MASWPVSGTPGNCTCGGSTAATVGSCAERIRRSATAEMRNQATFVTTDGHASWNAPLIMKAQEPRRFAVWKPLPALQPTHGHSQVRTEYRNRAGPTGDFPQQFHDVLSGLMPGYHSLGGGEMTGDMFLFRRRRRCQRDQAALGQRRVRPVSLVPLLTAIMRTGTA
jgi:hypothetical protein